VRWLVFLLELSFLAHCLLEFTVGLVVKD
jgi:hypothetical protein